ncbi:MAG: DUF885 domain-containing protein [Rudaea sp.]
MTRAAARRGCRPRTIRASALACALAAAAFCGAAVHAQPGAAAVRAHAPAPNATTRLHALFDDYWSWIKRDNPEFATFLGDDRYDDRLTDLSPAAIARRKAHLRAVLARLRQFDARALADQDALSLTVLESELERRLRVAAFPVERMAISPMGGPQLDFALLAKSTPFRNVADYDHYLARLRALPTQLEQIEALMREGLATGWTYPAAAMQRVPAQLDPWVGDDVERNPAWRPFAHFPSAVPDGERARLAAEGWRAIADGIVPAFRALKSFVETTYLPGARRELGATTLPGGAAYYDAVVAQQTTTTMSARDIHALGLREVARINGEMDDAMRHSGFTGTRREFYAFLRDAPQFYYTRPEDLLTGYRDIAKRVDAQLPRLFATLPRLPYGVRAMEAFEGDNADHYTQGSANAGRAGYFEANVNDLPARPKYAMEATFLHEAVPGHHLQIARAQELDGLPEFRRNGFLVAYGEGWALYAESLGTDLGMYENPYAQFGRLTMEMLRACRLVVDTGLHAQGWDRRRAIDYLVDNSGLGAAFAAAEVDRYIVIPGQALGYKIGELAIKRLRAKASAALGERFDLRRFHNAVLDDGPLPLDVLERRIDRWIAAEKARAR